LGVNTVTTRDIHRDEADVVDLVHTINYWWVVMATSGRGLLRLKPGV